MGRIHRLDPIVANQIAAGEVVERPASVVKELVENSLDAGASRIDIAIVDAGLGIWVRDDGVGMEPDDLARAVERHSTSKLTVLEDLDHSATLGFRGEALAAIASVSELSLASRVRTEPVGYQLTVSFGTAGTMAAQAMDPGTRVVVQRIFGRQPARLKALRSPAAEFGAIQQVVQQLAICRSGVAFSLSRDQRSVFVSAGREDPRATVAQVFGREVAESALDLDYEGEAGLSVRGLIVPAHQHRANRTGQGLYINDRWVQNWHIRAAVEEAFRPNVPERRYPYFWIWITLPLSQVDPNAHPAKAEVRLDREQAVRAILYRAVRETLETRSQVPMWPEKTFEEVASLTGAHESQQFWSSGSVDLEPSHSMGGSVAELVPLAQWRAKYIVAQGPEGLYLIDQHAAHERIYFERFRNSRQEVRLAQPLLLAITETLSGAEWAAFLTHRTELAEWGFDVEPLGGTTVSIQAVPQAFRDLDSHRGLLRTVLELLSDGESVAGRQHPVLWSEEPYYAMAACKAAIKAYRPMSMREMQELLAEMGRVADPRGCPHGRPTMWVITLEEADRRFGRRS
jgi:DNA mismatch repair protein MutL